MLCGDLKWKGNLKERGHPYQFSSVQSLSCVRLFVTPWTAARQASLSITNSWSPPKPMSIESVMPSSHLILCHPLLLLPSIFPRIRVFSNESALRTEKAMAPHSSTLVWKIPWMEEPGGLQSMGSLRVGHDWMTSLSIFTFTHWRRNWQPTPVFLPWKSQGWGSLVGCRLWVGHDWSDLAAAAAAAHRIKWPKYWSFSFNEHPGLISFRIDWLDLHAVQGTLKSLLQHICIMCNWFTFL